MSEHVLRLLALDGGGIRGLSMLEILKQLMSTINQESPPKPCDCFDMIGGTSTGGLIAIMLGRLQMTVDECIDAYVSLSDQIFQKQRHRMTIHGRVQSQFDSDKLERAIKEIVVRRGLAEDALLKDSPDAKCKVFVCATSIETGDTMRFTSYRSPRGRERLFHTTQIWEAGRATSAASSFFDSISIGDFRESFVDGGTGANNPLYELWNEARDMWPSDSLEDKVQCIVSIGTGVPSLTPFKGDLVGIGQSLIAIATETEKTAERFSRDKSRLDDTGRYYRFSVLRGLEDIGLEGSKQKNAIIAATDRYIESQAVFKQIKSCADALSGENKEEYDPWYELLGSLCLPNLEVTQIPQAYRDTCSWIGRDRRFTSWLKSDDGIFWIMGKPGSGKSTLMKHITRPSFIETLHEGQDTIQARHFFTSRGEEVEGKLYGMLSGLLFHTFNHRYCTSPRLRAKLIQTARQLRVCVADQRHRFDYAQKKWDIEILLQLFAAFFDTAKDTRLLFMVDGVDECQDFDNDKIISIFQTLIQECRKSTNRLHILFTSRPDPDVEPHQLPFISLQEENLSDIRTYVIGELSSRVSSNHAMQQYQAFAKEVINRADGVFLWAHLVVPRLRKSINGGENLTTLRSRLAEIPQRLEDLFRDILSRLDPLHLEETLRLIQIVALTTRPLNLDEIRHAFAFGGSCEYTNLSAWENSDKYWERGDQIRKLIQTRTGGLVEISENWSDGSTYVERTIRGVRGSEGSDPSLLLVRMLHETAKEYFIRGSGYQHLRYLINLSVSDAKRTLICPPLSSTFLPDGHNYLARLCSKYLELEDLHLSIVLRLLTEADRTLFPLAGYAIDNCLIHASAAENGDINLSQEYLLQQLFAVDRSPPSLDLYIYWAAAYHLLSWIEPLKRAGGNCDTPRLLYKSALRAAEAKGYSDFLEIFHEHAAATDRSSNLKFKKTRSASRQVNAAYSKVTVLLITFHPLEDVIHCAEEVEALGRMFGSKFNYSVLHIKLRPNSNHALQIQLNYAISCSIWKASLENSLVIVYYGGHGYSAKPGQLYLGEFPSAALQTIQGQKAKVVEEVGKMTGARNDRPEPLKWPWYSSEAICLNRMAEWSATRCAAMCSQADVLYILDCCSTEYLDLRGSYDARSFEYLGANRTGITLYPGKHSFTSALMWALEEMGRDSTSQRLSVQELATLIQKAPDFPQGQVPLAVTWNINTTVPITIGPLAPPKPPSSKFSFFGYLFENSHMRISLVVLFCAITIRTIAVGTATSIAKF